MKKEELIVGKEYIVNHSSGRCAVNVAGSAGSSDITRR